MAKAAATEGADPKPVITLPQLAEKLGVDRSTLVRLEQRGITTKAPFITRPYVCRVYDAALEKEVTKQVNDYFKAKGQTRTVVEGPVTLTGKD